MNIQWYPGHMTKTRRLITENLKHVDAVCEILDARIPISSRNPDLDELARNKPRLIIFNRVDLSDPETNKAWARFFKSQGMAFLETDSKSGAGVSRFGPVLRELLSEMLARYAEKGMGGRPVKAMICGIPNVGKSTFINRVAGRSAAKAENRPGVTRSKQWIAVPGAGVDMMDTPGILWPKFEDKRAGLHLAYTGAVRDEILDTETLACFLMETLGDRYPKALEERYKITVKPGETGLALLTRSAEKRGFRISGGEVDLARMANVLLDEFRAGTLGRMTLEDPGDIGRQPLETLQLRGSDFPLQEGW